MQIYALAFSPTGNTRKVTAKLAEILAVQLHCPWSYISLDTPADRKNSYAFSADDLVIVGGPTYAGKLPNKILPWYQEQLKGTNTPAIAVVTFGNRSFDNSLAELASTMTANGFRILAAGAFAAEHAFTPKLATARPDEDDQKELQGWTRKIVCKIQNNGQQSQSLIIPGNAAAPYYVPKGMDGQPAKFLKAKPKTKTDLCRHCGHCAKFCPMGSISADDPSAVTGICIKCQRCVRDCPSHAKYFDDPAFLSHVRMLERNFQRRAHNLLMV